MTFSVGWKPFTDRLDVASVRLRAVIPSRLLRDLGHRSELCTPEGRYDVVVFQKAYEEADVELARSLRAAGTRTVFDLCDNHFHQAPPERADRLLRMIDTVDAVTVSTPELAKLVPRDDVEVVGDALDVPRPGPPIPRLDRRRTHVVWYGHAGSETQPAGLAHLGAILPELAGLDVRLTVISNSREQFDRHVAGAPFPVRYHRWRRSTFAPLFRRNDVCVIPVEDNPFTRCKTNNRLVLSLLLGVPVVADPLPSYLEFSGFVLFSDWRENVERYAADRELRERHVAAGRAHVLAHHGNDVVAARWSSVLSGVLRG